MVADIRDLIRQEFRSPAVNVGVPRFRPIRSSDFMPDTDPDPYRAGTRSQLGIVLPKFQTPGAVANRRGGEVAGDAEFMLDSLGPNATEAEKEYLQRVIAAGGFDPEEGQGGAMRLFLSFLEQIDKPRKLVNAAIADIFNIGEEFSYKEASKQILGFAPSATPEAAEGMEQFRNEEGELLFTGSQLLRAAGWDTPDEEASVFEKALRGTFGFGVDFVTDPLNWVSWGTLGLGRASAQAAARTSIAGSVREAAESLIRTGTLDDVTDPFAQRLGRMLVDEGKDVRVNVFERAAVKEADRLGRKLTATEEALIRKNVDRAYYAQQARQAANAIGGDADNFLSRGVWDELDDLLDPDLAKSVSGMLDDVASPIEDLYDDIFDLIDRKQFAKLEADYGDFVKSKRTGAWATGGLTITTPFARKAAGGIKIGWRTDRGLTKVPRETIAKWWKELPYDGMRGAIEGIYKRWGTEVGEMAARRQVGAWTIDQALGLAKHAQRALGTDKAPGMVEASLRYLRTVVENNGENMEEVFTVVARALDEGWDTGRMIAALPNAAIHDAAEEVFHEIDDTLQIIHKALRHYDPSMGEIEHYFPMVATDEFIKLVNQVVEGGLESKRAVRILEEALEGGGDYTDQERLGLNLLAEWFHAVESSGEALNSSVKTVDRTKFMSERMMSKTIFSQVGGINVGILNKQAASDLMKAGARPGWATRVELNEAIRKALEILRDNGGFKGKLKLESYQAFSMDLPHVLNSYVKATSNVIHWRALIREGKRLGLIGEVPKAFEIGNTLADLTRGPLSRNNQEMLRAFERWAKGEGKRPVTRMVKVIDGWSVNLPEELADDARVLKAFKRLRESTEKAMGQTSDVRRGLEDSVRKLIEQGVDESLARELVMIESEAMLEVQNALFEALNDKAAQILSAVHGRAASIPAEKSYRAIQAAIEETEHWAAATRQTLADIRNQYAETFGFTRYTSDKVVDMLSPLEDGKTPLSVLLPTMNENLNKLFVERVNRLVPSQTRRMEIASQATTWDLKLSVARALEEEVAENILPEAVTEAWREVVDQLIVSDFTFADLVRAVGGEDAIRIVRKLSGFAEPEMSDPFLRDVAETFANMHGRPYMPRQVTTVGDERKIRWAYESLENVNYNEAADGVSRPVRESFDAWRMETLAQYEELRARGFRFEPYEGKGQPYTSTQDQLQDILENKHVWVPVNMIPDEADIFHEVYDGMPLGNLFDSLHIVMGHAMHSVDTKTQRGVTEAWLTHGQMYSEAARDAFTTLTRGRRVAARNYAGRAPYVMRKMDLLPPEISMLSLGADRPATEFAHGLATKADLEYQQVFSAARAFDDAQERMANVMANEPLTYWIGEETVDKGRKTYVVKFKDGTERVFEREWEAIAFFEERAQAWSATKNLVERAAQESAATPEVAQNIRRVSPPLAAIAPTFQTYEDAVAALYRDLDRLRAYRAEVRTQVLGEELAEVGGGTPHGRAVPTEERALKELGRAREVQKGTFDTDLTTRQRIKEEGIDIKPGTPMVEVARQRRIASEAEEYFPTAKVGGKEFRAFHSDQLNVRRVMGLGNVPEPPKMEFLTGKHLEGFDAISTLDDFNEWETTVRHTFDSTADLVDDYVDPTFDVPLDVSVAKRGEIDTNYSQGDEGWYIEVGGETEAEREAREQVTREQNARYPKHQQDIDERLAKEKAAAEGVESEEELEDLGLTIFTEDELDLTEAKPIGQGKWVEVLDEETGEVKSVVRKTPSKTMQVEIRKRVSKRPVIWVELKRPKMVNGVAKKQYRAVPLPSNWTQRVNAALRSGNQSHLDALFEETVKIGRDAYKDFRGRWASAKANIGKQWNNLTQGVGEEGIKINMREILADIPDDLRQANWNHDVFSDPAFIKMHAAAREKVARAAGKEGVDGRKEVGHWLERKMSESDELAAHARFLDGPIQPDGNVMEEIARAAAIPGDASELARYETQIKWLFEHVLNLDPKRVNFEVMADGTTRFQYLAGNLVEENFMIPPDEVRLWLDDLLPFDVWGIDDAELVRAIKEAYDSGLLDLSQVPEELQRFVKNLPTDGMMTLEASRAAYLRDFIGRLQVARGTLRRQLKGSTSRQIDAAADAAQEVLDEVIPMLNRRVGNPERLDELWDQHKKLLERVLPEREFQELMGLVEIAPVLRQATARARAQLGKLGTRRWVKVGDAYDAYQRTIAEVEQVLYAMGPDLRKDKELQQILKGLDLLWDNFKTVARRGRATAESAGLDIIPETPEGFRQVTTNKGLIEEIEGELKALETSAKPVGRRLAKLAEDEDFQRFMERELEDILPEGADIEVWLKERAAELRRPKVERRYTPVMIQANRVSPTVVGITGEELAGMNVDSAFAVILESLASNVKGMTSPVGLRMLADGVRGVERYWKGAVTVGRPTFVPRNLLGGVFNNGIIDVGFREYLWVSNKARIVRKALDDGHEWEDAMRLLSKEDREVFEAAADYRLFDAEFSSDIADPLMGRAERSWNPAAGLMGGNKTFIAFDIGGKFMQTSEDFLRMAAFKRWYVNGAPETAALASNLAFAVHFDYSSLTRLETKVKKLVPFFVWTRRNIPLQAKLMLERPGIYNRYMNIMRNVETSFEDREYSFVDRQPIPTWMGSAAADLDTVVDRGEGVWTRMMFAPDLPTRDLEQLVARFSSGNPISNGFGFFFDMIGPTAQSAAELATNPDFFEGKTTAPTGLAGVLRVLNKMGLWADMKQGEPQISYGARNLWETAFPFVREWTEVAGIAPNDGMRSGDLGYRLDDGVSLEERALGSFMGIGKAFGLRGTTPHDSLGPMTEAERAIEAIERAAIGDLRLPIGGAQGAPKERIERPNLLDISGHIGAQGKWVSASQAASMMDKPLDSGRVVVDGDTLKLRLPDGTTESVRLLGVNTPEKGELGFTAATAFLEDLLATGGKITLVPDLVDEDVYGRKLRYVWVGDQMLNLELVRAGLAQPQPYYPNRAFEQLLDAAS